MELVKEINPYIFRGYDIRGVYPNDINENISYTIGRSFGSKLILLGKKVCIIGRDNRLSSTSLHDALVKGILESGVDIVDLGLVTTPMYYYASIYKNIDCGIMITASHNPKDENGFKIAFDNKGNAYGEIIEEFRDYTKKLDFHEGMGTLYHFDIKDKYYELMKDSIIMGPRKLKVVIDCGNGTTSLFAKDIYSMFNIDLISIFDESDATFPNHHPDPFVEENLIKLKEKVLEVGADIGIAFDGDGDRVGVISDTGEFVSIDKYMIIIARDLLRKYRGAKILYDVKCSKVLPDEIIRLGGIPYCSRTGNSYTKRYTKEENCIFGGELSGHVYFRDDFLGFDSGIYAGLRLVELLSYTDKSLSEILKTIPKLYNTPEIKLAVKDEYKFDLVDKVINYAKESGYNVNTIDGARIDFDDGFALIRASNTGPNLTLRFEGETLEIMQKLEKEFTDLINSLLKDYK